MGQGRQAPGGLQPAARPRGVLLAPALAPGALLEVHADLAQPALHRALHRVVHQHVHSGERAELRDAGAHRAGPHHAEHQGANAP